MKRPPLPRNKTTKNRVKFEDAVDSVRKKILGKLNSFGWDHPRNSLQEEINPPLETAKTMKIT